MEFPHQDPKLIHELLHEEGRFLAFIRRRVGTTEAAEDILQSAYLKSIEKGHQLRSEESVTAWFFALIRHSLIDHFRNPFNARTSQADLEWLDRVYEGGDEELSDSTMGCVQFAMRSLREDDVRLITWVDLQGRSQEEVSRELGISTNALSVRLTRARKDLRAQLQVLCRTCRATKCLYCRCGPKDGVC
jgi:RNA polymerase sigma factor (sigma-70 family)